MAGYTSDTQRGSQVRVPIPFNIENDKDNVVFWKSETEQ